MSYVPSCGCFAPNGCHACMLTCPVPCMEAASSTCGINKTVALLKKQPICSLNNCGIFGGHDTNPFPEYPCPARRIKAKDENRNSLGAPIGLVASNNKIEGKSSEILQVRYATYLKAFARLHLNAETTWTPSLIDDIINEGHILYSNSEKEQNKLESPNEIYTDSEKKILREFEMDGCNFQIELMEKFKCNTVFGELEANGNSNGKELKLENLKTALKYFFRHHTYCLLTVGSFYTMIWRARGAYFIFDVCGRRIADFNTDHGKGVAVLICLKTFENVRYLIVKLSALKTNDPVCLREMKIVKIKTPSGSVVQRDYGTRIPQYQVVNDDYAYLKAGLHLTLNKTDLLRNRSALPVGVTAITVSKIDHPATWNRKLLDKILCFGVNFCQACWINCLTLNPIDVSEFPCYFNMGQFCINIELLSRKYEGTWRCVPGYKYSELAQALEKAFENEDQKLLVQINYQMYAIWKKHGFIYLFDPYRHRILGNDDVADIYDEMEKSSTVRMFRDFEIFMKTFNHILLDSNRTSQFYIHVLKIKNIQHRRIEQEDGQPILNEDDDIKSINEYICFEESDDFCQKALGDISDYEDEDLKSDIFEMELKTSSSEAEDNMEEEEAGAGGMEEDIEGVETSSSGDEGGVHKETEKIGKRIKGKAPKGGKGGRSVKDSKGKGRKGNEAKEGGGKKRKKGSNNESDESSIEVDNRKKQKKEDNGSKGAKYDDIKNNPGKDNNKDVKDNEKDNKDKDNESKDKPKDDDKPKDYDKAKDSYLIKANKHNNLNKVVDKEIDKDKAIKDLNKDQDNEKDKTNLDENVEKNKYGMNKEAKAMDKIKAKNSDKDKDIDNNIDKNKDKDLSKSKAKDLSKNNAHKDNAKNLDKDNELDKYLSKEMERDKDNHEEKDKDKLLNESKDKDLVQDKDKNKNTNENKEKDKDAEKDFERDTNKNKNKDIVRNNGNDNHVVDLDKNGKSFEDDTISELLAKEGIDDAIKDDLLPPFSNVHSNDKEADDEKEENTIKDIKNYCSDHNPNCYPGYFKYPVDMAVVGSQSGSYASICKLFQFGFKVADRILILTPWGNFFLIRCLGKYGAEQKKYFLFNGCTCNVNRFRHLDLSVGTAGLICFEHLHNIIKYIRCIRKNRDEIKQPNRKNIADICRQYCL